MEENKGSKKKTLITVLVIVVFLAAGFLISWRYTNRKLDLGSPLGEEGIEVQPTAGADEPSPTIVALERADLKVQVLNGTGEGGAAGEGKDLLEALGYQEVDMGNADSYNFKLTEITLKEGKEEYFELISKDLENNYQVASEASVLEEESEFDSVVTLGTPL